MKSGIVEEELGPARCTLRNSWAFLMRHEEEAKLEFRSTLSHQAKVRLPVVRAPCSSLWLSRCRSTQKEVEFGGRGRAHFAPREALHPPDRPPNVHRVLSSFPPSFHPSSLAPVRHSVFRMPWANSELNALDDRGRGGAAGKSKRIRGRGGNSHETSLCSLDWHPSALGEMGCWALLAKAKQGPFCITEEQTAMATFAVKSTCIA